MRSPRAIRKLRNRNSSWPGACLGGDQDYKKVEALTRQSMAARRKRFGERSIEVADCEQLLGKLARLRANFAEREPLLEQSYKTKRELLGEENLSTATAVYDLANLAYARNNFAKAETLFQEALRIRMKLLDADDPVVLDNLEPVGYLLEHKGDLAGAEAAYRKVLAGTPQDVAGAEPLHRDRARSPGVGAGGERRGRRGGGAVSGGHRQRSKIDGRMVPGDGDRHQ